METGTIISKAADVVKSGRESEERRLDHVCVLVLVDTTVPTHLALAVRDAFDPRMPDGEVRVVGMDEGRDLAYPTLPDVCVVLCGRDVAGVKEGVSSMAWAGVPVAAVAESALDVPTFSLGATAARRVSVVSATNAEVLNDRLAEWLIGATDKSVAFAANFPFCRQAKVRELIRDFAIENAKMGYNRDLTMMSVNQARLALDIAAVNGQPLAFKRIPEVLSAVGAGVGSRFVANRTAKHFPLLGTVFTAGFGFLETEATGRVLQARFAKQERQLESHGGSSSIEPLPSVATRAATALRSRVTRKQGTRVSSTTGSEVRLLPSVSEEEPGYLEYDQGDRR